MSRKQESKAAPSNVVELINTSVLIPEDMQQSIRMLAAGNKQSMGAEIRDALAKHIAGSDLPSPTPLKEAS